MFLSWKVLDCSVAMAYAMLSVHGKTGRAIASGSAFLRGFASAYPLQAVELKHLHLLIACRLAFSCTIGAYSIEQNPENTYLLLHSKPAWTALELIWGSCEQRRAVVAMTMNEVFAKACVLPSPEKDGVIDCTELSFPDPQFDDLLLGLRSCSSIGSAAD
jgi:hypothetical protein